MNVDKGLNYVEYVVDCRGLGCCLYINTCSGGIYEGHNTPLCYHTDQGPMFNGQGAYCDLNTAYVVFLIFTTQLCQYFSVVFFHFST